MSSNSMDIAHIVRSGFTDEQGPQASRKYMAYSSSYGLRVAAGGLIDPDSIQQVYAARRQIDNRTSVSSVSNSAVSDIMEADEIKGVEVVVDYDRGAQAGAIFPWSEVQNLLGQPSTVYDVPIKQIVVRFSDEEFTKMWKDKLDNAIEDSNFPTNWVEGPFYAVLESSQPDSEGRSKVKNDHEDRYFLPKSNTTSSGEQGLGWSPRVLDLESVWSHRGWTERNDPQLEAWSNRQGGGNWTPKRIEQRLMNFFESELQYTGMLRDDELMNKWRSTMGKNRSHDYTSFKTFEWVDEEEWSLQS